MSITSAVLNVTPRYLSERIRGDDGGDMQLRRGVIGASLLGIVSMAIVTLFQSGVVKRLKDPPIGNFDSNKVNSSDEAYGYGGPDAPIAIAAHAVNMVLATSGPPERSHTHPWLPVLATLAAGAQAATAAKYLFYQMPKVDKAWCPYCIFDAFTHFATLALTLPEAARSVRRLRR